PPRAKMESLGRINHARNRAWLASIRGPHPSKRLDKIRLTLIRCPMSPFWTSSSTGPTSHGAGSALAGVLDPPCAQRTITLEDPGSAARGLSEPRAGPAEPPASLRGVPSKRRSTAAAAGRDGAGAAAPSPAAGGAETTNDGRRRVPLG